MLHNDLLLAFTFMGLLFLRQIVILKRPNKINYAPLMIGVGAIAALVHFIIHPQTADIVLLIRESLVPLLLALMLYIIMNILHQTQISEHSKSQEEFTKVLVEEIYQLKEFIGEMEEKINTTQDAERESQEEIRLKFKEDIRVLDTIQLNQTKFIDKFEDMESWHKSVSKGFEFFSEVQLPELDNVVHKHIDVLRVAEQDHYNKLNTLLQRAVESRGDMSEDIEKLKTNINAIKTVSSEIASSIKKETISQLSDVTKAFETQLISLKSHTESLSTSLTEDDNRLGDIRIQSEIIMKQMTLSADKMQKLQEQSSGLYTINTTLTSIVKDVEAVKSDYVKAQSELGILASELRDSKDDQIIALKIKVENLTEQLTAKIDESLEKLHEHYHIADGELSQSVQMLSKRAQMKNGYEESNS